MKEGEQESLESSVMQEFWEDFGEEKVKSEKKGFRFADLDKDLDWT